MNYLNDTAPELGELSKAETKGSLQKAALRCYS
jgi:hypothetical protein